MLIAIEDPKLKELRDILDTMAIPKNRNNFNPDSLRWLARNLGIRNFGHKKYERAIQILKEIIK